MKLSGKVAVIVVAALFAVALAACGSSSSGTTTASGNASGSASATSASASAASASATASSASAASTSTSASAAASDSSSSTYKQGSVNGQVWSSFTFGIKCTLPSDWSYYDKDQLSELNSAVVADMSNDSEIKIAVQNGQNVIEMAAANSTGQSINANVTKSVISTGYMSTADMIDAYVKQAPEMYEKAYGWPGVTAKSSSLTFCGMPTPCADVEVAGQGQTVKMTQVVVVKDKYILTITATDSSGGDPHQILSYFSLVISGLTTSGS